jgi:hypothetical protein
MEEISKWFQLLADVITSLLGLIAIFGLIFKRKKIGQIFQIILNTHFNEKLKRLRDTLSQLDAISFEDKTRYQEGLSLLGQLSGQIKPMVNNSNDLLKIHTDLNLMLEGKSKIKNYRKNALIHELTDLIENMHIEEYLSLIGKD